MLLVTGLEVCAKRSQNYAAVSQLDQEMSVGLFLN
jgi:hypothetical protein